MTAGTTDTVTVAGEDGSVRLDRWFKRHYPALGHGRLEKLLRTGFGSTVNAPALVTGWRPVRRSVFRLSTKWPGRLPRGREKYRPATRPCC